MHFPPVYLLCSPGRNIVPLLEDVVFTPGKTSPGMTSPGATSRGMTPPEGFWKIRCPIPDVLGNVQAWPLGKGIDEIGARSLKSEQNPPGTLELSPG